MKIVHKRIKEKTKLAAITKKLHDYAYFETIVIVSLYLVVGYIIDSNDICMTAGNIPYMLILLAVITLFHGFESGMIATGILASAMWYFYPVFLYVDFLISLMMTLIFSEFHYYWTKRIREAQTNSQYYEIKLNELSKAFYTLKTSHDQLEKNYVIKPMSLRHSIRIIKESNIIQEDKYENFLKLLETSYNVSIATIVYKQDIGDNFKIISKTVDTIEDINFKDLLIIDALEKRKPVYISDEATKKSKYIAVIPALYMEEIVGLLLIEKMPFMSFNKENLTSVSILFEYFSNEMRKQKILIEHTDLGVITDDEFRFEYFRLYDLYKHYRIDSISFVFKIKDPLLVERLYTTTQKLLRSLDIVTLVKQEKYQYVVLLFPFADKASAFGFMNRLLNRLGDVKEKDFEYMTFDFSKMNLLEKYLNVRYVE
ncbi:MAG: PelD GGDEF domain-containing protein [Sulfurimonas sp.]|uniref:PelD GGDEF domain-containing protein n=1 Tax=Sulfurimonas sp. TaxID=2022749 RepID=UPI002615888F|nr:PelD GGDEF domain-containing protein [Sulfurimonas sp.]MDD5400073.1 PelD GGDEF domain-containing protein [Sulfurimonas sp.]